MKKINRYFLETKAFDPLLTSVLSRDPKNMNVHFIKQNIFKLNGVQGISCAVQNQQIIVSKGKYAYSFALYHDTRRHTNINA